MVRPAQEDLLQGHRTSISSRSSTWSALAVVLFTTLGISSSSSSSSSSSAVSAFLLNSHQKFPTSPTWNLPPKSDINNKLISRNNGRNYGHWYTLTSCLSSQSLPAIVMVPHGVSNLVPALTVTITGGLASGSLHAIAGPDHLAALLPRCCGMPWHRAARVGALWGMGHGLSATLLGLLGLALKRGFWQTHPTFSVSLLSRFSTHAAETLVEFAIGVSLIVIGVMGIKEARQWEHHQHTYPAVKSLSAAVSPVREIPIAYSSNDKSNMAKRTILFNGILHGFSWDGAPSLAPAIAMATWQGSLGFLLSYALGTMAAMTLATTAIGEGTRRASRRWDRPDLPRMLSGGSSFIALLVGIVWCGLAVGK